MTTSEYSLTYRCNYLQKQINDLILDVSNLTPPIGGFALDNVLAIGNDTDLTALFQDSLALPTITNTISHLGLSNSSLMNITGNDGLNMTALNNPMVLSSGTEILFKTDTTDRMIIDISGNVGINTIIPAYPLDVSGSAKFTTIVDTANLLGTSGQVLSSTGSALSWITPSGEVPLTFSTGLTRTVNTITNNLSTGVAGLGGQTAIGGTGITDILKLQGTTANGTSASPAIQAIVGNNGATTALTVLNSGNVGIGTTTPTNKLEIVEPSTVSGSAGINVQKTGTISGNSYGVLAQTTGTATTNYAGFFTATGATNNYGLVVSAGNVGIGTTAPAYLLDVNGSAKMTTIRDTLNSVGTSGQLLSSTGSALSWIAAPSSGLSIPNAVITETQPAGTNSPISFTLSATGTLRTRQFNVVVNNGLAITLGGTPNWTFTIPTAGTYLFDAVAVYSIGTADGYPTLGKLLLNNQTLGLANAIVGTSARFGSRNSGVFIGTNNSCFLNGILTITGITIFSLDHIVANTAQTNTGGYNVNLGGAVEIYATIKITKLA